MQDQWEAAMTRLISALWLVSNLAAGTAWAQPYTPNEMGVTMGHWHLNSNDIEASKKIFAGMGGTAVKAGDFEVVRFPGVVVMLHLRPGGPPSSGGTDGTVVNHVGFVVQDVQESVAKWKAAGVPVQPGNNNRLDQAYVTTPDGLKIEILEDKKQAVPIRHEHVHFFLPESALAKPGVRNESPVADLPGVQLRFAKTATPTVTTKGRVLDHIGFDVKDLQGFIKTLEAAGIKLDRPYTKNAFGGALAFITDPWGTYIELNERPNAVYLP
jgi:catechol 2,3-dioxygenase-like lactoylglutathione lyase family enzyme